ncbi:uncharacterized protein BDR25DRAFT_268730 [Lindgomyces ingoldianus]|uniref:Uncharacterized protein n=1 Tax=Lindgomyces ingoldianus TaxID=673940 RepID=A0ACB6QH99_9PLEO|nr:uncharacterized protein BDR25DRAFT_268730 [Lindgomyces ingoldianus]KAF2466299.1 hypothetical protein BDR25DRAFT_268730 [Lindgomyces ingoldianus]
MADLTRISRHSHGEYTALVSDQTLLDGQNSPEFETQLSPPPLTPATTSKSSASSTKMEDQSRSVSMSQEHFEKPHSRPSWRRHLRFNWWWEAGGLCLSILCVALIAAIMFSMHNRALPDWNLPIQPNSLIAVFSTIAKTALLVTIAECISQLKWAYFQKPRNLNELQVFDDASRGPWGSLVFLWKTGGTALLASVGAVLTILLLLFEPFAQQVLEFPSRLSVLKNETGWMSASHAFSDFGFQKNFGTIGEFNLQLNIEDHLQSVPSQAIPPFHCPTDECTIPDFSTLGVCTSCESHDVSVDKGLDCVFKIRNVDGLKHGDFYHTIGDRDAFQKALLASKNSTLTGPPSYNGTKLNNESVLGNCTVKDDIYPDYSITVLGDACIQQSDIDFLNWTAPTFGTDITESKFVDGEPTYESFDSVFRMVSFNMTSNFTSTRNVGLCGDIKATISLCRLTFCVHSYQKNTISKGHAKTQTITKLPLKTKGNATMPSTATDAPFADLLAVAGDPPGTFALGPRSRHYFNYEITRHVDGYLQHNYTWANDSMEAHQFFVNNLADGLSEFLRSTNNANMTNVTGSAFGPQTYIRVRWQWLIIPLATVVATVVFFFFTVLESGRARILFKSSALAALFHGLEGWSGEELKYTEVGVKEGGREQETAKGLARRAEGMRAALRRNGEGVLKFVKQE